MASKFKGEKVKHNAIQFRKKKWTASNSDETVRCVKSKWQNMCDNVYCLTNQKRDLYAKIASTDINNLYW